MFRAEHPHSDSLWLLSVSIRFTETVTITVAVVKEETPFVIARDRMYPDHTITMVDNGARVFVLAEKILSAQQGNALLGKSWKKATLQGKVLSKVANKRARLVKFHLLKQPIPVSTRILSLDENLVTVKGKRKLESRMNVTPESAPSDPNEFSDDDANLEDMDENENSSNKVDLNNDEEVSKSKDGESMDENEVETESEEDDTTMNENDINDDDDDGDGGGDGDGSVDDDHGESGNDDDHDDGGIDDSSDEDGDNDRDDGGDDCDDGAVDGIVEGGVNRKQQQKITSGKRKMQQKIAHVTVGDLQWKHYLHPMDIRVANGWKEKPKITWDDNLSDLHHGALNYFLLFFLKPQIISEIIEFTNQRLERTRQKKLAGKYNQICWSSVEENTIPQSVTAGGLAKWLCPCLHVP